MFAKTAIENRQLCTIIVQKIYSNHDRLLRGMSRISIVADFFHLIKILRDLMLRRKLNMNRKYKKDRLTK